MLNVTDSFPSGEFQPEKGMGLSRRAPTISSRWA